MQFAEPGGFNRVPGPFYSTDAGRNWHFASRSDLLAALRSREQAGEPLRHPVARPAPHKIAPAPTQS